MQVSIKHVTKCYDNRVTAVDDLSLEIGSGEFLVLVGPSGCGKTTTLRMIAGLETTTQGSIHFDGHEVDHVPPHKRQVAMVFQNGSLYPHMTVKKNLAFGLKLRKTPQAEIENRIDWAVDLLQLRDLLLRYPHTLSGGQRQRIMLGQAIVHRPKIFLLDEPLSNFDAPLRDKMRREIRRLHNHMQTTTLYVTHDAAEAYLLADRVAILREGHLQQVDEPVHLYRHPANRFVAQTIGNPPMSCFEGRIETNQGQTVFTNDVLTIPLDNKSALGSPTLSKGITLPEGTIVLGIRPEQITPCQQQAETNEARIIGAVVESIEPLGAEYLLSLRSGSLEFIALAGCDTSFRIGQSVDVALSAENLYFFDATTGKAIGFTH